MAEPDLVDARPPHTVASSPDEVVAGRPVERWVTAGIVAACAAFVLAHLQPALLLADTTAAGGDMGAHVWGPAYLRDELLPSGQLTGWAPDWYAGFPAYRFYMVLPSLLIVLLDVVLPYNVAFKSVTVLGLVALPVAAWALGRLARLPFPGPALLSVAAVAFLFDRSFTIYGGNVASTLAGEFAFSHSLAIALVFVGVVLRGLETGRHRALAAGLLALTALSHIIPAIFAVVAACIALASRFDRDRLRWAVPVGVVGGLLTTFWTLPFVWRRPYLNDMGWERLTVYWERLLPGPIGRWLSGLAGGAADNGGAGELVGDLTVPFLLAVVGVVLSVVYRRRLGIFLGLVALAAAFGYLVAPQGRLWNARLLPFWYLCVYLLAAVAFAEVARRVASIDRTPDEGPNRNVAATWAVTAVAVVFVAVAMPLRSLPFGSVDEAGTYHWPTEVVGLSSDDVSFLPSWARWNYSGYERKDAYPEYRGLVDTMEELGRTNGCGRAMWEYEPELDRFGTPMALMLLPYWTDGCIGSMEGLYFEASATTPYHFLNQAELSANPSRAQRGLPYPTTSPDVSSGVAHLRLLGVRYYLAFSDAAVAQAEEEPGLQPLTSRSFAVAAADGTVRDVTWRVYEVEGADLVEPLAAEPAVVAGLPLGGEPWLETAVEWYLDPARWDVFLAADGPPGWQRVPAADPDPERRPLGRVRVSEAREDGGTIRFEVSEPGSPVLVKASYFPNWRADGAEGPWRVAPNLMVVVPTQEQVVLRYGATPLEWASWLLTFVGIAGVVLLRGRDVRFSEAQPDRVAEPVDPDDPDHDAVGEAVPVAPGRVASEGGIIDVVEVARHDRDGDAGPPDPPAGPAPPA